VRWAQTAGRPTSFSFRATHIPLCPHVHPSRSPLSLARWVHASGAFLPHESRSCRPELSAMADLLAVEPMPPWTQSSRSYPSDLGASLGYKSGAVSPSAAKRREPHHCSTSLCSPFVACAAPCDWGPSHGCHCRVLWPRWQTEKHRPAVAPAHSLDDTVGRLIRGRD
jgi:hypothetical protein